MKEEKAMKKIYNAPEADLLCFRPVENLAIDFNDIYNVAGGETNYGQSEGATTSVGTDIKINIGKK